MQDEYQDLLYLLDANAIRQLDFDWIKETAKTSRMTTVDDVRYEVGGLDKISLINCVSLDAKAFLKMSELITGCEFVRKLLDYFENKGAADVSILSYVLTANEGKLITDEFVVVTEDIALRNACDNLSVTWCSVEDFRKTH